jgi:hypothetical protein
LRHQAAEVVVEAAFSAVAPLGVAPRVLLVIDQA